MTSSVSIQDNLNAYAFEDFTVSTTALAFASTNVRGGSGSTSDSLTSRAVLITCNTNAIRYRVDGTNPTATVGHRLAPGETLLLCGIRNITKFRMIRDTADSNVAVTFFA